MEQTDRMTTACGTSPYDVFLCTNDGGWMIASVAVRSALDHAAEPWRFRIWLLSDGVTEEHVAFMRRQCEAHPGARLEVVDVSKVLAEHAWFNDRCKARVWPMPTWGRLFAPSVLPEVKGKAVYLDTDTYVCADLATLLETDLRGNVMGVVHESFVADWDHTGNAKIPRHIERYFNAGVELIDFEAFRRERCLERILDYMQDTSLNLRFADQDAANACIGERVLSLHPAWNWNDRWTARAARVSLRQPLWRAMDVKAMHEAALFPGILHFWGRDRPWQANHRAEGARYAETMRKMGLLDGPLPGTTAWKRVTRACYDVFRVFLRGFLRWRLTRLEARGAGWVADGLPPCRESPRSMRVVTEDGEPKARETVDGVDVVWNEAVPCAWTVVCGRADAGTPRPGRAILAAVGADARRPSGASARAFAAVLAGPACEGLRHPGKFRCEASPVDDRAAFLRRALYAITRTPDIAILRAEAAGNKGKGQA